MKKVLLASLLVIALSVPSFAFFHLGVNAGYAYANLDDVNTNYKKAKQMVEDNGGSAKISTLGNAVFANVDLDLGLLPVLNVGPRVGVEYVFPVTNEYNYSKTIGSFTGSFNDKETATFFLVPVELGLAGNFGLPMLPVSLSVGAYGGYGFAFATMDSKIEGGPVSQSYTLPYNGGGFMGDLSAAVEWNFLPFTSLSLNAGYRYALIENLDISKSVTLPDGSVIGSNQELQNFEGSKMKANFSGFLIGLGINFRF